MASMRLLHHARNTRQGTNELFSFRKRVEATMEDSRDHRDKRPRSIDDLESRSKVGEEGYFDREYG
jgi:hypothetical protein